MGSDSISISNNKPVQLPTQEEDPPSPTTSLLSFNTDRSSPAPSSPSNSITIMVISLLLTSCVGLSAAGAFAFLFFSAKESRSQSNEFARPLTKLSHPVVLLISSDGFRFGYQFKTPTPNINRLIDNGTEAERGLIPVFPTLTFPNHYSIVTGLYPAYHGIVNNYFIDPHTGEFFTMGSHEPHWWLGEPLWETVVNHGLKAATYFWPGSEVKKGSWTYPENLCQHYNNSVPLEDKISSRVYSVQMGFS